jgi:hypothetical protein
MERRGIEKSASFWSLEDGTWQGGASSRLYLLSVRAPSCKPGNTATKENVKMKFCEINSMNTQKSIGLFSLSVGV